jgi:2-dehydro-3-deoxygluconokinase
VARSGVLGPWISKTDDQPRAGAVHLGERIARRAKEPAKEVEHGGMVVLGAAAMPEVVDVVALGEMMVLLLAQQAGPLREAATFSRHVAGAEANVLVGICRLGGSARYITRLGDDEFGRVIFQRMRGEGVDVSGVIFDASAPTGLMIRERREVGPVDVLYYRRGSAASRLSPADLDAESIAAARFVVLSGITPALSQSARETVFAAAEIARAAGVTVVVDPNLRFKLWSAAEARTTIRDLVGYADIVLPGMEEAELLSGEPDPLTAAKALLDLGPGLVVVKLGERGALALTAEGQVTVAATPIPRVVDPVGAGDAFAAGFLTGQLRGMGLEESLVLANRCGAAAMLVPADQEGLPRWDEVAGAVFTGDVRR